MTMFQGDPNLISTPKLLLIESRFKAMPNVLNLFTMKWTWRKNVINVPNMKIYFPIFLHYHPRAFVCYPHVFSLTFDFI